MCGLSAVLAVLGGCRGDLAGWSDLCFLRWCRFWTVVTMHVDPSGPDLCGPNYVPYCPKGHVAIRGLRMMERLERQGHDE